MHKTTTQLQKIGKIEIFLKRISEKIEILSQNLEKTALNRGIPLFSAVYKPQ
jgi:hypothetical protein